MGITLDNDPYVMDKNLGEKLQLQPDDLPASNADGQSVEAFTQEQKYSFDNRGWILFPGLLSDDDIEAMREFALRVHKDPESLPEHERTYIAGPLQKLVDHPLVVSFMNEFVAHPHLSGPDCYGFRMESTGVRYRLATPEDEGKFNPHNGSGLFRFAVDSHLYQCVPGKAFSGLTRVVWELTPVQHGQGGTLLATGSHKAAYAAPDAIQNPDSPLWDTYECPAGSLLIFTEALTHSTARWTSTQNDRVAIFNLYNTVGSKWSQWEPHPDLLAEMPPTRQTLFRDVRCANNLPGTRYYGGNQRARHE